MHGDVLPETMVKNERSLTLTDDGGAELDAEAALEQVVAAIDEVLERSREIKGEIAFAATSSFWHSLVGVDARGKPTTPVLTWADTRSRERVATLRKRFDEAKIHNRTGARFHSSFWPAKLLWLRSRFPKQYAETDRWLSFSDFVALRLFGTATTGISMASATGIFDIRKCGWDRPFLRSLEIPVQDLPEIAGDDASFRLHRKFERRWQRLRETKWLPAIGDGAANNIGAGCVTRSKAALMIGTSGAMRVLYEGDPPEEIPPGLWCYRVDRRRVIIGGALSDGGGLYRWLKDNFRLREDDDHTEDEVEKRPPAGHGITFLPFLAGERSTGYNENAAGAVIGLKQSHDKIDIVQAALESVAYRFAEIFDQLNSVAPVREIVASGGALRESPVWTQIIADVIGKKLSLPDTREASSRGAVLHALELSGAGKLSARKTSGPSLRLFKPDRKRHAIYKTARAAHEKYYRLLIDEQSDR